MPDLIDNSVGLAWLRVDASESETVNRLVKSAMYWAEGYCGQPLFERVHTAQLNEFYGGYLSGINPRGLSVNYTATNGTAGVWGPFTTPDPIADAFYLTQSGYFAFRAGITRPLFGSYSTLTYTAGFTPLEVPENIINALLLVAAYDYDHRANPVSERPTAAERLLQPHKIYTT